MFFYKLDDKKREKKSSNNNTLDFQLVSGAVRPQGWLLGIVKSHNISLHYNAFLCVFFRMKK